MKSFRTLIIVFIIFSGCHHSFIPKGLHDNQNLWEIRKMAIDHHNIRFSTKQDFFLIEIVYINVHYGCFFIGENSYCFEKSSSKPNILDYKELYFESYIVESVKQGNVDTLLTLSQSINHIVFPAKTFFFTRFVNGSFEEYSMRSFTVDFSDIELDFK